MTSFLKFVKAECVRIPMSVPIIAKILTPYQQSVRCYVPCCSNWVRVTKEDSLKCRAKNKGRLLAFCEKHKEFMSHGGYDDGDPSTNPEFEALRKKSLNKK